MKEKTKRGRRILRDVLAVFLLVLLALSIDLFGLSRLLTGVAGDAMDWRSHYLAGLFSVNCGRVRLREDPTIATDCALKANSEGRAFRVIYNLQGFDSTVAGGVIRKSDGKLLALSFDGCVTGCGFSFLLQRVWVFPCPEPNQLYTNPKGRLNCFQPKLANSKSIMAPNFESY
jgi:hypothetical protein